MFEFLKTIFLGKPARDIVAEEYLPSSNVTAPRIPSAPKPQAVAEPQPRPRSNGHQGNGHSVEISLRAVLDAFPLELKGRIKQPDVGEATVSIPSDKVLAQLSRGSVKVTFGELRHAAPQLFSSQSDCDQTQITLPLNEILLHISPALLARRQDQKHIEVPEEIRSPFGEHGDGLIFSVGPTKSEAPAAPRAITPATPAPPAPPASMMPPTPQLTPIQPIPFRGSIGSTPMRPPPVARPSGPPPASMIPPMNRGVGPFVPPVALHEPVSSHAPIMPQNPIFQPAQPVAGTPSLSIPLIALAEAWPEALRHEIVQLNLVDAKVALPVEMVEQALKRGKVAFQWKVLRSWIKPAPLPTVSVHDNAALELPLKTIAPLFLNRSKESGKTRQRVAIDESIPNLFFGFPQPGEPIPAEGAPTVSHAVSKPLDTNYYVWDDTSDTARIDAVDFKRKLEPSAGTTFVTRCATPNEVVSRAAAMDGVAGALIALPDGLMVASKLSQDLNGDTLAAFLPHIFGKVSQCTKELRMGELNNLNFTVGNVPWKIFRVNAIFFAAFGRAGEPLPTAQLAALATELDHKPK